MQTFPKASSFLQEIDKEYLYFKRARMSRFSVPWGKWSRRMNLRLRAETEAGGPETTALKYVFIYWVNRSQLLELYSISKLGKLGQKKKLETEGREIKKGILSGKVPKGFEKMSFAQIAKGSLLPKPKK